MPKPRARQLTAAEEAIISKGGGPGNGALAEPIKPEVKSEPVNEPVNQAPKPRNGRTSQPYRTAMIRFIPEDYEAVEADIKRLYEEQSLKISLNAWIVSACLEKVKRNAK